jgi:outer membrane usher protein FimD/PapC
MSYYDNPQWSATGQQNNNNNSSSNNNWDHQGTTTPVRAGASAPQPQDDYAFSYQFDGALILFRGGRYWLLEKESLGGLLRVVKICMRQGPRRCNSNNILT